MAKIDGAALRQHMVESLDARIPVEIPPKGTLKFMLGRSVDEFFDTVVSTIHQFTRSRDSDGHMPLAELCCSIGHKVRKQMKLPVDSRIAARLGAFFVWSFEDAGIISTALGRGKTKHATYQVTVELDEAIEALWELIPMDLDVGMPHLSPPENWTSFKARDGVNIMKTRSAWASKELTPEACPMVFDNLNRLQNKGFTVNSEVLKHVEWALDEKSDAFSSVWTSSNRKAYQARLRANRAILMMATKLEGSVFYHRYTLDFRGRVNVGTNFFHEQSNDLARGLMLRAEQKPIGEKGFQWLCISLAGNWAGDCEHPLGLKSDKIPLLARINWAKRNFSKFVEYAINPRANTGWMAADNPWQFLAACIELRKVLAWRYKYGNYDMPSGLEAFIDGSNNGSQHLAALTRDQHTAKLVNLTTTEYPEDLYLHVAEKVWSELKKIVEGYGPDVRAQCESFVQAVMSRKKLIGSLPNGPGRTQLIEELKEFKKANEAIGQLAAPVFWLLITQKKEWRKILKRNVLSLPYGATAYGMAEQVVKDSRKHGIPILLDMEHKWGAYLGRFTYDSCKTTIPLPMKLLAAFEDAGVRAEERGEFLHWRSPFTNLPVEQHYTEGVVKKVRIQYGPPVGELLPSGYFENTLQLHIPLLEEQVLSKGQQARGASPNVIHSLDAVHLMLIINRCPFGVTTIHDSFGALLCDMPELFRITRRTFLELYKDNPLYDIMDDIQGDMSMLDFGDFDISSILNSEYSFT